MESESDPLFHLFRIDRNLLDYLPAMKEEKITIRTLIIASDQDLKDISNKLKMKMGDQISFLHIVNEYKQNSSINSLSYNIVSQPSNSSALSTSSSQSSSTLNSRMQSHVVHQTIINDFDDILSTKYAKGSSQFVFIFQNNE